MAKGIDELAITLERMIASGMKSRDMVSVLMVEFEKLRQATEQLVHPFELLNKRLKELDDNLTVFKKNPDLSRLEVAFAEQRTSVMRLSAAWKTYKQHLGGDIVPILGSLVVLYAKVSAAGRTVNEQLMEAVSLETKRIQLVKDVLGVSQATGVSYEKVAQHAKALINYGLENYSTWKENLKVVTQMAEMMEVSAAAAAKLAAQVEVGLGSRFKNVADQIARIVENTALTGTEASEIANEYTLALKRFGGASSAELTAALEALSRYEDAVKRTGRVAGEFTKLVTSFTDFKNAAAAAVTQSQIGSRQTLSVDNINRVAASIQSLVRSAQASGNTASLKLMADQLGLNIDMMDSLTKGLAAQTTEQKSATSVQERFNKQMQLASNSFKQLGSTLWAMTQEALLPALQFINAALSRLARAAQYIDEHPAIKNLLTTAASIGAIAAVITAAVRTIPFLATAFTVLLNVAKAFTGIGTAGGVVGMIAARLAPAAAAISAALASPLLVPILAAVAGITALVALAWKLYRFLSGKDEEERNRRAIELAQKQQQETDFDIQALQNSLRTATAAGDTSGMLDALYGKVDARGRREGGALVELMSKRYDLSYDEALKSAYKNDIEPVIANLRTTAASLTRYDEPKGAEASQRLEERLLELIRVVREVGTKAITDIHEKQKEALDEAKQQAILRTNALIGTQNAIPQSVTFPAPAR